MRRSSRSFCCVVLLATGAACTTRLAPCHSSTQYAYDPDVGSDESASVFPDDYLTVADGSTVTGLRVSITAKNAPWSVADVIPAGLEQTVPALNTLDGWGTTAGIAMRFTAAVKEMPTGSPASVESKTVQLWELGAHPHRVPFETQLTDSDASIILWPMFPLKPATRHAVFVLRTQPTVAGDTLCPSDPMESLLDGSATSAELKRLVPRYAEAMKIAKVKPEEIGAAVVFTTQSIEQQSVTIAADIHGRTYTWKTLPACEDMPNYRKCTGVFVAQNYQTNGVVQGTQPTTSYDLPVHLWLPLTAPKPWPTMIFGHGLGEDTNDGEPLAALAAPMGFAVIGVDAVAHGSHPGGALGLPAILNFFGMTTGSVEPLVLRDNWRQSTYDKLQLLRLLEQAPDVDGDGQPDLDLSKLAYYGVSLGGIMGGEFLALQDRVDLAILSVPGGRVMSIVSDAEQFAFLPALFAGAHTSKGDIDRFFPILQTIIERGDSANYATHMINDRLPSANTRTPHLLFMMVLNDNTVPNVCNNAIARAIGVPQLPPVVEDVGLIPLLSGTSVSDNVGNGARTAALFQYDRMTSASNPTLRPATHSGMSTSTESLYQVQHLLETWLAGKPEVVNPYSHFNTPPLPPAMK